MFRFTQEPLSGSQSQCLDKITGMVPLCLSICALPVLWRHIPTCCACGSPCTANHTHTHTHTHTTSGCLPMKMEPIRSSETSAIKTQTPGNYPKRNILHLLTHRPLELYQLLVAVCYCWYELLVYLRSWIKMTSEM